ncbi:MAG TPA: serine protease, partial [Clostridiales bacterium]|nr:serine protease [Clostridiales bacterium]
IQAAKVSGKAADDTWIGSSADFALELFKQSVAQDKNALISPLSVMLALAMTANGADSQTKAEMEALLGGTISLDDLNKYLYSYV